MSLIIKDVCFKNQQVTSLEFDGVDDIVNVPNNAELNSACGVGQPRSVIMWLKTEESGNTVIMEKGANQHFVIQTVSDEVLFRTAGSSGGHAQSTTVISDNKWHMVMGVYDGTNNKIYVDDSSVEDTTAETAPAVTTDDLQIGARTGTIVEYPGNIAEIMIFNREVTEAEKNQIYALNRKRNTIVTDGLVAYYRMENGSGTTLVDVANSNDGTITGAIWDTDAIDGTGINMTSANIVQGYPNGSALSFNGIDEGVTGDLVYDTSYNQITMVLVFKSPNLDAGKLFALAGSHYFDITGGAFRFLINNTFASDCVWNDVEADTWYVAMGVYDGVSNKLYVNGDLKAEDSYTVQMFDTDNFSFAILNGLQECECEISYAGIFSKPLTDIQVKDLTNKLIFGRRS